MKEAICIVALVASGVLLATSVSWSLRDDEMDGAKLAASYALYMLLLAIFVRFA